MHDDDDAKALGWHEPFEAPAGRQGPVPDIQRRAHVLDLTVGEWIGVIWRLQLATFVAALPGALLLWAISALIAANQ